MNGQERVQVLSREASGCIGRRGCPCELHARRRVYARRYAARKRARAIGAKRMTARTCPRGFGRYGVCGAVLESDVIGGSLVVSCPACERMARGICRDCPRPVDGPVGRARRCAVHRKAANHASCTKHAALNRRAINLRARKSYQDDDAARRRRNDYKRLWRKLHPDKVKAQKRREALRGSARRIEYHTAYNAAHRRKNANRERARYHDALPPRTCITPRCSIVVTGRKKKCSRCKARDAQLAAQQLAAHTGRGRRTDLEQGAA